MHDRATSLRIVALIATIIATLAASDFETQVVASGLDHPTGIVADGDRRLFFTEVPMPGVAGGSNGVKELFLADGSVRTIHMGEPQPTNLALRDGVLSWTCVSAGVILGIDLRHPGAEVRHIADGLTRPTGLAATWYGLVFTEIPTPGVPGSAGGSNRVAALIADRYPVTLHAGDPEPYDVAAGPFGADLYWTCRSAGVIVHLDVFSGRSEVIASGLASPTGIAVRWPYLYWTEVPTPGIPGSAGGRNLVSRMSLLTHRRELIHAGDPWPQDVTVAPDGSVFWTCSSAGVIVEARRMPHAHG